VCVDRPLLSLDRPFTYEMSEEIEAGVGSLVQVPFHGKATRGWVLGSTDDVPMRMLRVRKRVSPVRFFDERMLELLRWMSERYVAPLAAVIARSHPPRVASEEADLAELPAVDAEAALAAARGRAGEPMEQLERAPKGPSLSPLELREWGGRPDATAAAFQAFGGYRGGEGLVRAIHGGSGAFVLRPIPEQEQDVVVEAVRTCLASGRRAIVLVPEADPIPATAAAVIDAFAGRVAQYLGGGRRARYRMWLDIQGGRFDVVVGTRPAAFAPVRNAGLVWVAREHHPGHREERSPYYHVRDVALVRARLEGGVCVMASLCPSAEAMVVGADSVTPAVRSWPPVEVVRPGPEGRAPRLVAALRTARRGFLYEPLPGYGVARSCRSCGEPAACSACGGVLRLEGGTVRCAVCHDAGHCASCGGTDFGIARGGAERVAEWAARTASVPVAPGMPGGPGVAVGGAEAVKDLGPLGLDLVGILDADLAAHRPGLFARERALGVWMDAAGWARLGGRVIVQTRHPADAAVQALVTGNPERFYRSESPRRERAGFPPGCAVFRMTGTAALEPELPGLPLVSLLTTRSGGETICLATVRPGDVGEFGRAMRRLAGGGAVTRVEAEPHL
jgi:primosomal protein N' (replication factor Y) (superfamily II helicase)